MTNHPPLFEFDPGFPLVWCEETGKLHSDEGNTPGKFPRNCPFCNCCYTNFQSWQRHVCHDHHCKVTLTDTEQQRIKKRELQVKLNVAAKKLNDMKKKRHERTNRKNRRYAMDANDDFDTTVHGSHKAKPSAKTLVKIGISKIPGAGRGVFANVNLVQHQVLTRCDGTLHSHQSTDIVQNQYTIEIVQEKKKVSTYPIPCSSGEINIQSWAVGSARLSIAQSEGNGPIVFLM
jgi:hypothetical protein